MWDDFWELIVGFGDPSLNLSLIVFVSSVKLVLRKGPSVLHVSISLRDFWILMSLRFQVCSSNYRKV